MKKIISIIVFLQCAIVAFAVTYATPYKGAGRNGYVYSTTRTQMSSAYSGIAQVPTASMQSTCSSAYRGIAYAGGSSISTSIKGITTSASDIRGGVTAEQAHASAPRRNAPPLPGACEHCQWVNVGTEENPIWKCVICDCYLLDGCDCDPCHCDVPLELNFGAMLFMAVLAVVYAYVKKTTGKVLADK